MPHMSLIHRRDFILGAASVGALAAAAPFARAEQPSLKELAASKGLLFGTPMRMASLEKDAAYAQMMARECSIYVSAEMHWRLVARHPQGTNFSRPDAALAWARAHGMRFRGHSLLWHLQTPAWFSDLPDARAAAAAIQDHIHQMCRHYAGKIQSWDVVNEAILTKGGINGLRKSVFLEKIGPDYLDIAFRTAREADPHALLVLNENYLEYTLPGSLERRRALLAVVDGFKRRNTPIDAIGIQSHLATEFFDRIDQASLAGFLNEISDRGLKIMITEMDVLDRSAPSDVVERDSQVAAVYKRYLDAALDNPALIAVITWGLTDKESWIVRGDLKNFKRSDGLPARPLPFDEQYRPKKAYQAIVESLRAAPVR